MSEAGFGRIKKGSSIFKPKARLLILLGEQLISNEVVAVVELIKNSFDADATTVSLIFENVSDREEGEIIIEDNGTGMTLDTVLNVWLEPATESRKLQRDKGERTELYKRPLLGEKGIGRFAVHRLGNVINMVTRAKDSELEVQVEVNWLMFGNNKYLDEVPVNYVTRKPKIFVGKNHGTMIIIRDLKKDWSQEMIRNLAEKLDSLRVPLKERFNFEVKLTAPEFPEIEKRGKIQLEEILEKALYSFEGSVSECGCLEAIYQFRHQALPELARKNRIKEDLRHLNKRFSSTKDYSEAPSCGPFDIRIYAWDLDRTTLNETVSRKYYETFIEPHTGVRIYRDGFKVWPYGEHGNDWLNLDIRRVNNPTKCVSNNQIIGIVNISSIGNPPLVDKTDREGILDSEAFEDFKSLVLSAISEFEAEREKDKKRVASLREGNEGRSGGTAQAINLLREKLKEGNDFSRYEKEIDEVEKTVEAEARQSIEPLVASAGIGLTYLMPAHEIASGIRDLERLIGTLQSDLDRIGVGGRISETAATMLEATRRMKDIADGVLELTRRKIDVFSLESAVNSAIRTKEPQLTTERVKVEVIEKNKITIRGAKNLVVICLLNLLDNSIYWLSEVKDKVLRIIIDYDADLKPRIVVSDNGPGIVREDLPYLGEASWTRKPNGSGLGLFIAKKAMRANGGEVDFGFYGEEPDFLVGANVVLRFKREIEIKG